MSKGSERRRELEKALRASRAELQAVRRELAAALARVPTTTETGPSLAAGEVAAGEAMSKRERALAIRVAELEAGHVPGAEADPAELAARTRELNGRLESLTLQLEEARGREEAASARTIHAEDVLAASGARLAELGASAARVPELEARIDELETERGTERADAATRVAALEAGLGEARSHAERADVARADAERLADAAGERAQTAEGRAATLLAELEASRAVLLHLDEVYETVRLRAEAAGRGPEPATAQPDPELVRVMEEHERSQSELRDTVARIRDREQDLSEEVAALRDRVASLPGVAQLEAAPESTLVAAPDEDAPDEGAEGSEAPGIDEEKTGVPADGAAGSIGDAPGPRYLSAEEIAGIAAAEVGSGLRTDASVLEAVAAFPSSRLGGRDQFPGVHVKAAALFSALLRRRPFEPDNERVALRATRAFFDRNGFEVVADDDDLAELTQLTLEGRLPVLKIAAAFEADTTRTPPAAAED
jgi:death-on-curing protein